MEQRKYVTFQIQIFAYSYFRNYRLRHLTQIFEKLGLTKQNGLYITSEGLWGGLFSNRVERLIKETIKPDAIFCIDNKPFILFFEGVETKESKLKEIWNFNESPVVIIGDAGSVEIYNGYNYISNNKSLQLFGAADKLTDFGYFELVTGKTWEKHLADFSYKNRIDFHLLENIKAARNLLISDSEGITKELANTLLGKVIFVRYLIDRKVKIDFKQSGESKPWTNNEFCNLLSDKEQVKLFFKYLKSKFNGDLFPINDAEIDLIHDNCLVAIINLLSGHEVGTGQMSFFDLYDFSIIPVEFISNVYELFIGQNEQEEQGAYYTPLFLVDYILAETVQKKLDNFPQDPSCKVLDPACGSGIFLVETLRKIIEQYQNNNPDFNANPESYKETLKKLACENIYGVDKDPSAVNVAIFSIYLTLLDYQNPSDIETFKFPPLLEKNFFAADFFDTEASYNNLFSQFEFDFILGNPPWLAYGIGSLGKKYLEQRAKKEKPLKRAHRIEINNGEIAEGFMLRASDFSKKPTLVALVVRSTILYNRGYSEFSKFRSYLLQEFAIERVFELAPVRFEVFERSQDPAIAPAAVLFYRYANGRCTDSNIVEHISLKPSRLFSLFKVFSISRYDFKKIEQHNLKAFDWLWKTLVYGSYLDFNLIKRLKSNYTSLSEVINDKTGFIKGTGITLSKNGKEDASHLIGKEFIQSNAIQPYFVIPGKTSVFDKEKVGRRRDTSLFEGKVLLVRNGLDTTEFKARAAIQNTPVVFMKALTGIRPVSSKNENILLTILANLHSELYSYLAIQLFTSIGIEREQTKDYEKFDIPFINTGLDDVVFSIIQTETLLHKERQKPLNSIKVQELEQKVADFLYRIDRHILAELSILDNQVETAIIDYALNVTRPLITRKFSIESLDHPLSKLNLFDPLLEVYIQLFLNRFNTVFKRQNQQLVTEACYSSQIIGVFFRLTTIDDSASPIEWIESDDTDILKLLAKLGVEKITDQLFIQKDVRGFEKDGFYIVKPNEKRLWHKAIGYLDVNEFADAMLTTGKNSSLNVR